MVQLNFDANTVAPNAGMEPVPEGWYNVAIDKSEMKPTKDGTGAYLELLAKIIDGQYAGKPIFIRLNLQNANQTAVDIAYGELSAIAHCVGVFQVADSSQLHGLPFQVKVSVRKSPEHGDSNDVKAYKDAAGNEPGKPAQGGGGQPGNFGGQSMQQGNGAPNQAQGQPAFQGQPQQDQQPNQNQQQPAQGGWGGNQGQPDPNQNQQQPDPNQGQGFSGGQATQPAQQQQPAQNGNGGWQQQDPNAQGGQPAQGGAPWGANQGQQ